jgi:hypothetical protein
LPSGDSHVEFLALLTDVLFHILDVNQYVIKEYQNKLSELLEK